MRWLGLGLALLLAGSVAAQDVARKKKKPQAAAHKKPTPEQIRKFKALEKKQKR